jgi:hypothetical protein
LFRSEPVVSRCQLNTGGEPLDIPFPRTGQRFIEIVDVEEEIAFRGSKDSEVLEMSIATDLYIEP